jgi:predicted secreted hydrolase
MNIFTYRTPCRGWLVLVLLPLALLLAGCGTPAAGARMGAVEAVNADNNADFARVTEPRPFVFPDDHGPHRQYQTEWWYYTGNVAAEDGRRFGFQLTFFRRGLAPGTVERPSAWGTSDIYMAHLALSDVAGEQFYSFERLSRGGAGLAGASGSPFRVFLEDWSAEGSGPEGMQMRLRAVAEPIALDLRLDSSKPPALQGERGYSQKGSEVGNASYYYSLTRMETSGQISIGSERYDVRGLSWMDHEFGTSALEPGAVGWDWFSIQLDDGRDLMYAQIRDETGAPLYTFGTLVGPAGATRTLAPDAVELVVRDQWTSPRSGATYPAGWTLRLPGEGLTLTLEPLLADQELATGVIYWEGAVRVRGSDDGTDVQGYGYVELTGYAEAREGRY